MDKIIEKFAKEHGHNFHAMVVNKLRRYGWTVLVSPFYRDNATDKAREADIIAEKQIYFGNDNGEIRYIKSGYFRVRLIIECKFVKESIIFWFDKKDANAVEGRIIKDISLFRPSKENILIKEHHWKACDEAVKLYASYNPNGHEKQQENEVVFSAIDKVLNCLINYRRIQTIIPENQRFPEQQCLYRPIIYYPVIVLNDFDKLYETKISDAKSMSKLVRGTNFEVEVNYEYVNFVAGQRFNMPEYFLVDVVDFKKLQDYLEVLKNKDLLSALALI